MVGTVLIEPGIGGFCSERLVLYLSVDDGHLPGILQEKSQLEERDELKDVQHHNVSDEELVDAFVIGPPGPLPPDTKQNTASSERTALIGHTVSERTRRLDANRNLYVKINY